MTRQFESALNHVRDGYRIFPAHGITESGRCTCGNPNCQNPGKHPAISNWQRAATTDPEQIRRWWNKNSEYNPAIPAGGDLAILDADGEKGRESLRRLEEEYGPLPPTRTVISGREDGGEHQYFRKDPRAEIRNSVSKLGEHLDIRGDGGYVIAPGARHASGRFYEWKEGCSPADLPAAEFPSWIPDRLHRIASQEKAKKKSEGSGFILPEGKITEGSRDDTLFRYASYLRGVRGKDMEFIRDELFRINREKCDPPLPDKQVWQKIYRVDKYPREGGAEEDFKNLHSAELICAADVPDEDPRFVLFPYIPEGQLTLIQGNPGDGKTAFACKLAAMITTGTDLLKLPCDDGNVLMLSVEDDMATLKKRFVASGGDVHRCFFVSNAAGLTFNSAEIERFIQERNIRVVFFDPMQAFLGSKVDMNRANETRPILAELKETAKRNSCAIVIVCHINKSGKDGLAIQRALGSMDIPGACRSVIHIGRLENDQDKRLAVHVKSSNAKEGKSIVFSIVKDGGVDLEEFSEKGYENLSELSKKTRKAVQDPFLMVQVVEECQKLLKENPTGIKIRYTDMDVPWPMGVRPGTLLNNYRDQLEEKGICIQTGLKYNGGSAVLITRAPDFLGNEPKEAEQLSMETESPLPLPPPSLSESDESEKSGK